MQWGMGSTDPMTHRATRQRGLSPVNHSCRAAMLRIALLRLVRTVRVLCPALPRSSAPEIPPPSESGPPPSRAAAPGRMRRADGTGRRERS